MAMPEFQERRKDKNGDPIWSKPNDGRMFVNNYKTEKVNHDFSGKVWMSLDLLKSLVKFAKDNPDPNEPNYVNVRMYINKDKNGKEFYKLLFSEYKYFPPKNKQAQALESQPSSVIDDDIPFD
tara:strand:+ start:2130 stop:2498 length:369 start_codon:yes stop_codon:yes gene_type:complete